MENKNYNEPDEKTIKVKEFPMENCETEGCCYSSVDFPKKKDPFDINPYE